MVIRHSAEKSFESCKAGKAVVYFGVPVCIQLQGVISSSYFAGIKDLGLEDVSLRDMEITHSRDEYVKAAKQMFKEINPNTGRRDVSGDEFYAGSIPIGVIGGIITPQSMDSGEALFNGEGTICIAEVLDGLNAMFSGVNANNERHRTLDNVSDVDDYFNEGYNLLCDGYSAPFFNLYRRDELLKPITRVELGYIAVVCAGLFGSVYQERYRMGISFDWLRPKEGVQRFSDWSKYKVSLASVGGRPSNDVKDYKGNRSMSEYIDDMKGGISAIPVPMMMGLVELGNYNTFHFEEDELRPLRQVTRGELCYFITRLAGKGV